MVNHGAKWHCAVFTWPFMVKHGAKVALWGVSMVLHGVKWCDCLHGSFLRRSESMSAWLLCCFHQVAGSCRVFMVLFFSFLFFKTKSFLHDSYS